MHNVSLLNIDNLVKYSNNSLGILTSIYLLSFVDLHSAIFRYQFTFRNTTNSYNWTDISKLSNNRLKGRAVKEGYE